MKNKLSSITLISLVLGIIFGLVFPSYTDSISFIGTFYITFLKYMIVPVVFTSITISIFDSRKQKSNLILKSILLFIVLFVSTFLITSILVLLINPSSDFVFDNTDWSGTTTQLNIKDILLNLIPKDLNKFLTGSYLFSVILMSFILGYILSKFEKGDIVIDFIRKIKDLLFILIGPLRNNFNYLKNF